LKDDGDVAGDPVVDRKRGLEERTIRLIEWQNAECGRVPEIPRNVSQVDGELAVAQGLYIYWPKAVRSIFAFLLVAWFGSTGKAGAEVHLMMRDGRVTLKASNATLAEILAEWAKIGQIRIVNSELVPGELVSIELTNVPEEQALDVILRSVAGYIAGPRPAGMANRSRFDRILILPTSIPPAIAASTAPSPLPEISEYSQYPQDPSFPPDMDADSPDLATPNPRGAVGTTYPAYPQPLPVGVSPPPASVRGNSALAGPPTPGQMPVGASVPGMPVQPPPQNPPAYPPYSIRNPQD
jgi:hypothetical protein